MANADRNAALAKAAEHWSGQRQIGRMRWWGHPTILRHINRLVCGIALDGPWSGLALRMRDLAPAGGFRRGLSIGCGDGAKELRLLKDGIVQHFDLYEISQNRVDQGMALSQQFGVADKVSFHTTDAFQEDLGNRHDLVYWNNALHHMLDVREAIRWSHDRLIPGGWFVMDDFVGASRFQWPDIQVTIANRIREQLPERFFIHPLDPSKRLPRRVGRPNREALIAQDPTEAADSENIIPALKTIFPAAEIVITGGAIYHLALSDVLANFDDMVDAELLQALLKLDEELVRAGQTHYAVAFARKPVTPDVANSTHAQEES